jgi:subtilisin family serine protease
VAPPSYAYSPRTGLPVCLLALALCCLAAGCGGDGGHEPTPHATALALVTQPAVQAQNRISLTAQPVVELQDAQGAAVAQAGIPVTASIATGGGTLTGTTTVNTASNGRATFDQLAVSGLAGPHTLTFSSPNLTSVTSGTISLSAGVAVTIAKNGGDGQTAGTGSPVELAPSVVVTDADNNPVAGVPVTFQVTAGGGSVDPAAAINSDANGIAMVTSWTLGASPGPNSLTATAAGLTGSPVGFDATGIVGATISGTINTNSSLMARTKSPKQVVSSVPRFPGTKRSRPQLGIHAARTGSWFHPRPGGRAAEYTPNELIVTFRAASLGAPALGSAALAMQSSATAAAAGIRARMAPHVAAQHVRVTGVSPAILTARIRVPDGGDLTRVTAELLADPAVADVHRNRIVHGDGLVSRPATAIPVSSNDPLYSFQAWHYGMIDLPDAWSITTGSASVLVAVVDDGMRFDHPGIAANLTADGYDFVSNISIERCADHTTTDLGGDGDGYDPDPTIPASYDYDSENDCINGLLDLGNHGLHVAGTIGAVGNDGVGVTGINWNVRIRPVRVLGVNGNGTLYDVAQGLLYAAGLPADNGAGGTVPPVARASIINVSLGGPDNAPELASAVTAASNAGSLIIAAAGNDGTTDPHYPASYDEVLSVSAVGPDRQLASYSTSGPTVDIAAPGGDFIDGDETFGVGSTVWNFVTSAPGYAFQQGTSMASPHVSGVAALILAANPGLSAAQLRSRLTNFAVDAGPAGQDGSFGAGIVNARNSLAQNLGPSHQLRARLYNALTGSIEQTVTAAGGSYSFTGVLNGTYHVFAGQDDSSDLLIGLPGRRWGAFGGTASPSAVNVNNTGAHTANFSIGFPSEEEPNDVVAQANILPVGGYVQGAMNTTETDFFRVLIPQDGEYTFETAPVDGACGFALDEDTVLGLHNGAGTLLASNDDIAPATSSLCSRITRTLTSGTYYVGVQGLIGGVYRVQARAGS